MMSTPPPVDDAASPPDPHPPDRRGGHTPLPICKAILLCDRVIHDSRTNTNSIIGIRDVFRMRRFPTGVASVSAFLQLVGGVGRYNISIEVRELQGNRMIARGQGIWMEFRNRLRPTDVVITIEPFRLPEPGDYEFAIYANGEQIDSQRFAAVLVQPPEPRGGG